MKLFLVMTDTRTEGPGYLKLSSSHACGQSFEEALERSMVSENRQQNGVTSTHWAYEVDLQDTPSAVATLVDDLAVHLPREHIAEGHRDSYTVTDISDRLRQQLAS